MSEIAKPRRMPAENLYVDSAAFWQGTREGRLMLQYCTESGRFQHFPRPLSLYTGTRKLEWRAVSGKGTVYAVTALRTPGLGADGRLPCVLALVDLEEGVRILANVLRCAPGELPNSASIASRVRRYAPLLAARRAVVISRHSAA